ncbi:MAG TPA: LysM peptidoglycan-binding domain-containing protein, partial [Thermoanaerobaculia bacterium]|nr:LysM peptidoglycan-binding domain-containing protein [Thermoanaerobaculia bacterium]
PGAPQGEIRGVPTPAAAITSASGVGPYTSVPLTTLSRQKEPAPVALAIPPEGFVDTPARAALPQDTRARDARVRETRGTRVVRHTVKKGDTLYSLAARYGTTIDAILRENRLRSPHALKAGQTLVLSLAALN